MLIQLQGIEKNYSTYPLFEELSLKVEKGERIGIVGTNGSGKSTILKMIAGLEAADKGTISIQKNVTVGYLAQLPEAEPKPVREYLLDSFETVNHIQKHLKYLEEKMTDPQADFGKLLSQYGKQQELFEAAGGYEVENRLEMIANGLEVANLMDQSFDALSGGEQTIINLARILLQQREVLLLDEPTNHLDIQRISWLEGYLLHEKRTCLIVSHDRQFLNQVVERIVEIEDGKCWNYKGSYSAYKEQKEARIEKLRKDFAEQQKEIQKIKLTIRRFRQWGHEGDNEKFFKKAKELERRLEKIQKIPKPKGDSQKLGKGSFRIADRSGKEVLIGERLKKEYDDRVLFKNSSFSLFWKERVAIIGENGAGKTTLMKLILEKESLDSGELKLGSNVKIGYLPQAIQYDYPQRSILQEFMYECSLDEQESRRLLAGYSFYKEDVLTQLRFLSGGEKIRLELAKLMQQKINFLLLDEPTNHLDIETREEVEEILEDFTGTLLAVSHDRFFLEKIFPDFLVIKDERITKITCSYSDFFKQEI
ncbi:ABC-F family ATP-binding cassette domain-containing protein [Enterococcus sp. BWB1-3]|uniref:ribosomal protection-like ABC-F family protein n=1 Tax=Enterococcus sp. BWB1-3 TaxID=2787713 RepID=UPI00192367BD|nr:ABC-F family ATP-binding cassette domain-containing protein [Enterococcus sp. BWB1-3]MBL1227665.1 ABC-F family ATP-binding cassette domain-containing protein [Enterococcus sp. BWB1-3]